MNYRKWPVQSVLWFLSSLLLVVFYVGWDLYKWQVRGKLFSLSHLFDECIFAVVVGWAVTLSSQARGVAFLTWIVVALLALIGYYELEKTVHLSPPADAAYDQAFTLLPLLVAVGAARLWRRRMKEIQTVR